jgi:type VI secretion system protein ImpL
MKAILVACLVFLVSVALIVWGGVALQFAGVKLIVFCAILGLLCAAAILSVLWVLKQQRSEDGDASASSSVDTANLGALIRAVNARIRESGRAKGLSSMPLLYVIGDENSAKTQTVIQSGLDPELLAGNVYQDGIVSSTQLANFWLAGNYILVEAAATILRQKALWSQLVKASLPKRLRSSFLKDSRLPARSVLLCVSIERILAPNTAEQIRSLAQTLNERLRTLSQSLGVSLPVYVLFTKLDNVAPFADYMSRLSEEEAQSPIGSLLALPSSGSGTYTEQAESMISSRFDQLVFALSEFRLSIFSRGGELKELARAYEFPRDIKKLRSGIVSFLREVARPSQIGVNPFLRGFFLTGMRARMVEDVIDVGPAQSVISSPVEASATRVFTIGSAEPFQPPAPSRRGGTRKVAQWVFLPQLFSKILLADQSALEVSRTSTRTSMLKRVFLCVSSAIILALLTLASISFFNNRSLETRLSEATAYPVTAIPVGGWAASTDLQNLDNLRALLDELERNRKDGAPFLYQMGLYRGAALYPVACRAYADRFHALLLGPTQARMIAKLNAVPSAPAADADYGATYRPLKAYLITTGNPDPDTPQDTKEFLPPVLLAEWTGNSAPPAELSNIAQAQFSFYADLLSEPSSCLAAAGGVPNDDAVAKARAYLNGFQGFEHVYQSMLAAANRNVKDLNFNSTFPGSAQDIVDSFPVKGAFTKDGFALMQDAIRHPDRYTSGEEWVLKSTSPPMDRNALTANLNTAYTRDYIKAWHDYLNKAQVNSFASFKDAADKLGRLDSNTSALLELFSLVSVHTGVASPEISNAFQAPQAIVLPSFKPGDRLISQANQNYIQGLSGLEGAVNNLANNPIGQNDPTAAQPVLQAAESARQAAKGLSNTFNPNPGGIDKTSSALLEAPIKSAEDLAAEAPLRAAGGGAKAFCAQATALLSKFPFNPDAKIEATPEEAAQIFAPGSGAFSQYFNTTLRPLIVQQGNQYIPNPGSKFQINRAFLDFVNNSQKISSTLFATGNQPSLDFSLTEVRSPGVPDAVLSIDSQEITAAGQRASFHWVSRPDSKISLSSGGNSNVQPPGPWSVFHFWIAATRIPPDRLRYNLQLNNQTSGVVQFDAAGPGASLLNPQFMKTYRCVSTLH